MSLISFQNISVSFGGPPVLDGVSLHLQRGDRVALVGRNGEGKSTLLRVLTGEQATDSGETVRHQNVRIGHLQQEVPTTLEGTVADIAMQAADHLEEWERAQRMEVVCDQLGLDPESTFNTLSGGQKRRALLARALTEEPDVLILDEPTNHLDLDSIEWLENYLMRFRGAVLFVTHDRALQQRVATAVAELDRGQLTRWDCSWQKYLERREENLAAEEKHRALFDKKLAQEEAWIRQGIKARRTRNEGRVRALEKLREERKARRERGGQVKLVQQDTATSGRKVVEATGLSHAWDGVPVFQDLDLLLMRGDKVGVIGPNGCGKSTLLQVLLGQLTPDSGTVRHGTNLELAWFDQHRAQLDPEKTVVENLAADREFVTLNGNRRHVMSYLGDFLFTSDRARTPVKVLSGGERNRLLLARLFLQPANLLILDEPTNDLDAETLELLEEHLLDYPGTLILVSHDRELLNRVVTSTWVFESPGQVNEYVGGYDDWIDQRPATASSSKRIAKAATPPPPVQATPTRKLSNKEREELQQLPIRIEELEEELATLTNTLADPDFYRQPPDEVQTSTHRATALPDIIAEAYARWDELTARA